MIVVIVIVAALALVGLVAAVAMRRRTATAAASPTPAPSAAAPATRAEPEPMTGLESALNTVTDRDGRPMAAHLDDETSHVDDLRVPDDTGPLLRRALDHVEHRDTSPGPDTDTDTEIGEATGDASSDGRGGAESTGSAT